MIIKESTAMATSTYEKLTNNDGVNMMYVIKILMEYVMM